MLRGSTKRQALVFAESVTGFGLRAGVPVVLVGIAYLLYAAFGRHMHELAGLSLTNKNYFVQSIDVVSRALTISTIVVVVSIIIRSFHEETVGQALTLFGGLLYFASRRFFQYYGAEGLSDEALFLSGSIVREFISIGTICLLPGLSLVVRDALLRIWTGISVRRVVERRWGDEEERRKRGGKPKVYGSCWDLPYCRDFVCRVCPAFASKKSCWRLKVGCYCDEKTVLTALAHYGDNSEKGHGIIEALGLDKQRKSLMNARQKRARCRRCVIYSEHQRQKYRILSPAVMPAVGLVFYIVRGQIGTFLGNLLVRTDRFMSFITYGHPDIASDERTLTVLAICALWIMAVSYVLRVLEYLIFELQV